PDVFLLAIVVFAPIGFVQPALQSLMTRRVRPSEQGQLQGANASIAGLTGVIGPILFTLVFAWFISANAPATIPGMPFFVAAVLMLGSLAVAFRVTRAAAAEAAAAGVAPAAGDGSSTITRDPWPVHIVSSGVALELRGSCVLYHARPIPTRHGLDHGLGVADVWIPPGRVQLRLGMPVQLRRSADARRLSWRVHVDHRQGRYGDVNLDGLGVALPGIWPGAVH